MADMELHVHFSYANEAEVTSQLICISGNSEVEGSQYGEFQIVKYLDLNYLALLADWIANEMASSRY